MRSMEKRATRKPPAAIATILYTEPDSGDAPVELAVAILAGGVGIEGDDEEADVVLTTRNAYADDSDSGLWKGGEPGYAPRTSVRRWDGSRPDRSVTIVRLDTGEVLWRFYGKAGDPVPFADRMPDRLDADLAHAVQRLVSGAWVDAFPATVEARHPLEHREYHRRLAIIERRVGQEAAVVMCHHVGCPRSHSLSGECRTSVQDVRSFATLFPPPDTIALEAEPPTTQSALRRDVTFTMARSPDR